MSDSKSSFHFIADDPCLDFVNTKIQEDGEGVEFLNSIQDLIDWLNQADLLDHQIKQSVLEEWSDQEADQIFESALELRKKLTDLADKLSCGEEIPEKSVKEINRWLGKSGFHNELRKTDDGFQRITKLDTDDPENLLYPIARSASKLLESKDLSKVKRCDNPECVLYFYDTTKNHSRRWCSMDLCGNRMKARRHYERNK